MAVTRRKQAGPISEKRPAEKTPPARRWPVWVLLVAALIALVEVYWPSMRGPFLFDDEYLPFRDPSFAAMSPAQVLTLQRPLLSLSFWLNHVWFDQDPFHYHLWNVLFHFVNGVLIFVCLRKLLSMAGMAGLRRDVLAAFAAGVFALHPVQTESVAYVAGRSESFSLMFFLGAYAVFLYKRENGIRWPAVLGVLALFACALGSKEHTAVLPGLLVLTDIVFKRNSAWSTLRSNWRLYVPTVIVGAAGVVFILRVLATADTAGFRVEDLPWYDYFYTQWRAWWVYLRLFLLPVNLNADYTFPISRSPLDHGAFVGLLAMAAAVLAGWWFRKDAPLAWFGILAFLLLLAPTSSVVPIKDPIAERRLYLPMLGLLLVMCDLLRRLRWTHVQQGLSMSVILVVLSWLTYARSAVWASPYALWLDTVEKSPSNARAHFQLAMQYYTDQRCPEALKEFEKTAKYMKADYRLLLDWGLAYLCLNQYEEALAKLRAAAALENTAHVRSHIGMVLARQNSLMAALEELNQAAALDPDYELTFVFRGNILLLQGDLDRAEADYRRALEINGGSQPARQGLNAIAQRRGAAR